MKKMNKPQRLQDTIKHANVDIVGVPEERRERKGQKKLFEEIMAPKLPKFDEKPESTHLKSFTNSKQENSKKSTVNI